MFVFFYVNFCLRFNLFFHVATGVPKCSIYISKGIVMGKECRHRPYQTAVQASLADWHVPDSCQTGICLDNPCCGSHVKTG